MRQPAKEMAERNELLLLLLLRHLLSLLFTPSITPQLQKQKTQSQQRPLPFSPLLALPTLRRPTLSSLAQRLSPHHPLGHHHEHHITQHDAPPPHIHNFDPEPHPRLNPATLQKGKSCTARATFSLLCTRPAVAAAVSASLKRARRRQRQRQRQPSASALRPEYRGLDEGHCILKALPPWRAEW